MITKRIVLFLCCMCLCGVLYSQQQVRNLHFRNNGEFRILQLTDTHYKWGKSASNAVNELIEELITTEDVDLVVFTGDNIYSENADLSLKKIFTPFNNNRIPFVAVFGNHDHQFDITQEEQWDIMRSFEYNMQPDRPEGSPYPDFVLPIYSSKGNIVSQLIYNFDSHAGYKTRAISRYDWLSFDQIAWYRQQSKRYTRENGNKPLPAIMFLHIPLPEYAYAYEANSNRKSSMTGNGTIIGTKSENVSCPKLNSGMFSSIKECGDVRGVFCGHDHDNDYALVWKDVMLAYGRYSGGKTVYNNLGKNGARIIVLHEGSKDIDTYIHLKGGDIINECKYPADFE